jgi:hypothetical protein
MQIIAIATLHIVNLIIDLIPNSNSFQSLISFFNSSNSIWYLGGAVSLILSPPFCFISRFLFCFTIVPVYDNFM